MSFRLVLAARALALALIAACAAPPPASAADDAAEGRSAVTLFAGVVTKETWEDALLAPWNARLEDGGLAVLHGARRLWTSAHGRWGRLEAEAEALLSQHWGAQDHQALALAPVARWRGPEGWPASAAFSLGLSAASEVPRAERATQGGSAAVMAYWALELEAGPFAAAPGWSLAARLHHRSTAYGLFGDAGGSNAFLLGLRRRF